MALVTAQPARAVTIPAVLALTELCPSDNTQILWAGSNDTVLGNVHSNAGMIVSGSTNNVTGTVTFDDDDCGYTNSGSGNTGGLLTASNADSIADPAFAAPTAQECTFTWTGSGDIDLNGQDGGPGEHNVWQADGVTLKTGNYCHLGTGKLQQSRQFGTGRVSFFANGYIDLSAGSNVNYTPFRADGVLTHSLANSVDGVTLAGSNSIYGGIVYVPFGEAEGGGQNNTIGCLVGETVKIDGSNNTIGTNCGPAAPAPAVSISKSNNTTGPVAPGTAVIYTLTLDVTNGPVPTMTVVDQLPPNISNATGISNGGLYDAATNRITWTALTNVADNATLTYTATVNASAPAGTHTNTATITVGPCVGDGCDDTSDVVVVVTGPTPAVVISKSNNTTGPVAPGTAVIYTLTFDVTNGPVPTMTVVDQLPPNISNATGISNGGTYNAGTNRITWTGLTNVADNATLTYTATVSATAGPGTHTNTATITVGPCVGAGCVDTSTITVPGGGALGGNPTPAQRVVPNTAMGTGLGGEPITVPVELLAATLLASLGAVAYANVRSNRRR